VGNLLERGFRKQAARLERYLSLRGLGMACGQLLAGRLAASLGGERLGDALVLRAARRDPGSPEAVYHAACVLRSRQGPIAVWLWLRERRDELPPGAARHLRARWLALRACVVADLRGFEEAGRLLAAAEALAPGLPGVQTARAEVLIEQDRRQDALAAVRVALRRKPWPVDAVQTAARVLLTLGRGREACDLLLDAAVDSEDSRLMRQLAEQLLEERRFRECLEWLERYEAASPLVDAQGLSLAAALRSRATDRVGEPCWPGPRPPGGGASAPRRVLLRVPFVQQDRASCSPATLAELAAFWRLSVEQQAVAQAICYAGTARHRARGWAEQQGFVVREFRVTWQSARDVLDRGVPFAMVTKWAMAGHDQAVVGYDEARGTLLVRCPSRPFLVEVPAEAFLAEQAWCGPRATALLPPIDRARLDGLDLPDNEAYDHLHAIETALAEHRRTGAAALAAGLSRRLPGSRLCVWAALAIARYDEDHAAELRCIEALQAASPGTAALEVWRLCALSHVVSPAAYERMLAAACRRYPREPALRSLRAHQLSQGGGRDRHAESVLWPVLRRDHWPTRALDLATLANTRGRHDAEEERALIELAAHTGDLSEWAPAAWFAKAGPSRREGEALAFLRARFGAYGTLSGEPAQTLYDALRDLGDEGAAVAVLEEALALRPDDHELRLFAARACAARGALESAEQLLAGSRGRAHHGLWLRARVAVAASGGASGETLLGLWRAVLAVEPAAVDAHRAVAELLEHLGDPRAAEAHRRSVRNRYPAHYALAHLGREEQPEIQL